MLSIVLLSIYLSIHQFLLTSDVSLCEHKMKQLSPVLLFEQTSDGQKVEFRIFIFLNSAANIHLQGKHNIKSGLNKRYIIHMRTNM